MAQFGKHLFGSSFFGKTATFDGKYESEVIDAGELFDGTISLALTATLPSVTYLATSPFLAYIKKETDWTFQNEKATTIKNTASLKMAATGSRFVLKAQTGAGRAMATVTLTNPETNTLISRSWDTSTIATLAIDVTYGDYILEIVPAATVSSPFTLVSIQVRVTAVGAEIRTAAQSTAFLQDKTDYITVPLSAALEGTSPAVTAKQFVQVRLHLSTSDSDVSPSVDRLFFSSGDISKYAANGYWYAAINLNNAATAVSKTFKKAKRLEWSEEEDASATFVLRSTSLLNNSGTSLPLESEILDASYWKAETAPYIVKREGSLYGIPYSRLSLGEAGNGFAESATLSSVLRPVSVSDGNFANTALTAWKEWNDLAGMPTNTSGVSFRYEFYKEKEDYENGFAPVFRIGNNRSDVRSISLDPSDFSEKLWLRIVLERSANAQSPVIHYLDLTSELFYQSPKVLAQYKDTLSGLDNSANVVAGSAQLPQTLGYKNLRNLTAALFNWPRKTDTLPENQERLEVNPRTIDLLFAPKYTNQVHLGFNNANLQKLQFTAAENPSFTVFAKTQAEEPHASTQSVVSNKLFFHYAMDGGTVNFPLTTKRELTTSFTPALLSGKKYRYRLSNGWPDESFMLHESMDWQAVSDWTGYAVEKIQLANPELQTFQSKLPLGTLVQLPNESLNRDVSLAFLSSNGYETEVSYQNGKTNDIIRANIPNGGAYQEFDWVSEEIIYTGILNPNGEKRAYIRTQKNGESERRSYLHPVIGIAVTAAELAERYGVQEEDIFLANQQKSVFAVGESVLIPGGLALPKIEPEVVYEGEHPYMVEIIPGSVKRTKDGKRLSDESLLFGSDDEAGLEYTLRESENKTANLTRGTLANGKETLPFSNVLTVVKIINPSNGTVYLPYQKTGGSEMGDFILRDNAIDWSPVHAGSKEPAAGTDYTVIFRHGIVDTIKLVYTSNYSEKVATDRLWRSPELKKLIGTVSPERDSYLPLPAKDSFVGFQPTFARLTYLVQDNDLWVQTGIREQEGVEMLYATLNGEDPKRNWHPEMQTGFYYLNDQEYYLYSEPVTRTYGETALPILEDVRYTTNGFSLI